MNDNSIQGDLQIKKKGNGFKLIIIAVLFLGIGIGVGLGVSKVLLKDDDKSETKEEVKDKEESTTTQESAYKKPEANSNYKLLKEVNIETELDGITYHIVNYYYDKDGEFVKDAYFENNKIVNEEVLAPTTEDWEEVYKSDKALDEYYSVLNDTETDDQYYFYFSNKYVDNMDEDDTLETDYYLINKECKVIKDGISRSPWWGVVVHFATLDDAGDRKVEYDEYGGDYIAYSDSLIDIKEDFFYTADSDECDGAEYKNVVTNGKVVSTFINKYEDSLAGQC